MKIESKRFIGTDSAAFYNPDIDTIYYDELLDLPQFLEYKKFIIAHEMRHQEYGYNYWKHIKNEWKDYWKLFNRDSKNYVLLRDKDTRLPMEIKRWKHIIGMFSYYIAIFPLRIILLFRPIIWVFLKDEEKQ